MIIQITQSSDGRFEVNGSVNEEIQVYFWIGFCVVHKDQFEINEATKYKLPVMAKDKNALFSLLAMLADLGKATPSQASHVEFFGDRLNPPESIFDLPTLEPKLEIPLERFKFELKEESDRP